MQVSNLSFLVRFSESSGNDEEMKEDFGRQPDNKMS